nr:MAG TPA: hypothetical protein [Caudoviricetes sp.]
MRSGDFNILRSFISSFFSTKKSPPKQGLTY